MADRFVYIPFIGLYIIIAWGIYDMLAEFKHKKIIISFSACIVLIFLFLITVIQVGFWKNSVTLFSHTISVTKNNSSAYYGLGLAYLKQEDIDKAIYNFTKSLQISPNFPIAHSNLANAFFKKGDLNKAKQHYLTVLKLSPEHYSAEYNLGKLFLNQKKFKQSIYHFNKILTYKPDMIQALYNLSWIYSTCGNEKIRNGKLSLNIAEKLCKITGTNQPLSLDALAAAYAETNQFDRAVSTASKAYKLALLYNINDLADDIKIRLKLYRNNIPYRQPLSMESPIANLQQTKTT